MIHGAVLISAFLIFWFLALFIVLPIGLSGNVDSISGAPKMPQLRLKVLIVTGIATVLWLGFYAIIALHVIDV